MWRRVRRFARTVGETCDDGAGGVDVCAVGVMTEDEEEEEEVEVGG